MNIGEDGNEIQKIEYLLRSIYLIRKNFPSSEYIYIIMFFLKYFGYILFSLSLTEETNSQQNTTGIKLSTVFSSFLITSNNLPISNYIYPITCMCGFFLLLLFLIVVAAGFFYMKKNYKFEIKINETRNISVTGIDLNSQILEKSKYGQKFFKFVSYVFFVIVFFHQYIIEYYFFGFLGHLLYLCGFFDDNKSELDEKYSSALENYFTTTFDPLIILINNVLTIFLIIALFVIFMCLNTSKCLFLQNGIAFSGNNVYLAIKIIFFNLTPFYGLMLTFQINQKKIFILTVYFIIIICYVINITVSIRKFSCIHSRLIYMCLFMETFGFVSCIHELIIFLVDSNDNTLIFTLIKYIIELFDTIILIKIYLFKQNQYNLIHFAQELFCNNYKKISLNDMYYYMETYLIYSKDKKNKYIQMFKLIKYHTLICEKSDCPSEKLISNKMLHSPFTEISQNKEENNANKNILLEINNEVTNKNDEKSLRMTNLDINSIAEFRHTVITPGKKRKDTTNSENTFSDKIKESFVKKESNKTIKDSTITKNINATRVENHIPSKFNNLNSPKDPKESNKSVQFKEFTQRNSSRNVNNKNFEIVNNNSFHAKSNNNSQRESKNINKESKNSLRLTNLSDFPKRKSSVFRASETTKNDDTSPKENVSHSCINQNVEHNRINIHEARRLKDEQFQIIGEQEIANRINFLFKHKKYDILEEYIFIHLQYLLMIKQNYRLVLYYVGKYVSSGLKLSFLSKYFLYEIKKYVNKNIFSKKNSHIIHDHYANKYREENLFLREFINYITLLNDLRKILFNACEIILNFFKFRKILHNPLLFQKYHSTKIYTLLKSSDVLKTSIKKIFTLLRKYYNSKLIKLKSVELSYLICNFFLFTNNMIIPQELLKYISPVVTFKDYLYEELENEYHMFFIYQPLIISLTKKDTFNITYLTNIFCERLGYNLSDLKNQDFHEKLFPSNSEMMKEHELLLKQFLFHDKNHYKKSESFILSKYNSLIPVNFQAKIFPTFINEFYIIVNMNVLNDESCIELNETNNLNESKVITYSFLLNNNFDFLGITENFFEEFEFTQEMLHELGVNYCQFFCIDQDKLISQIIKEKRKNQSLRNFKELNLKLKDGNNAYSIFKTIPYENIFNLRDSKLLDDFFYPKSILKDKINKKKIIRKIPELMNIADENGLDFEWMQRLRNYKYRLISRDYSHNEKLNNLRDDNDENEPCLSSVSMSNLDRSVDNHYSENYFDVIYYIHKIGSFNYYIANIYEVIKNDMDIDGISPSINNDKIKEVKEEYEESSNFDSRVSGLPKNNNNNFAWNNNKNNFSKFSNYVNNINNNNQKNNSNSDNNNSSTTSNNDSKNNSNTNLNSKNNSNTPFGINTINNIKSPVSKLGLFSQKTKFTLKSGLQLKRNVTAGLHKGAESLTVVKNPKRRLTCFYSGDQNIINNKLLGKLNAGTHSKFSFSNFKLSQNLQKINEEEENKKDENNSENNNENKENNEPSSPNIKALRIIDDENTPLLSGDKIKSKIKKLNKKNQIIIWIIYFLFLASIICLIGKYAVSFLGFSLTQNFLKTANYVEMLKVDLYVQTISSLVICLNDNTLTSNGNMEFMSTKKIETIIEDLTKLHSTITVIYSKSSYKNIFKIFYEEFTVYSLNSDWNIKERQTNLLEEVRYLSYKFQILSSGSYSNKCLISQIISFTSENVDETPNDYIKLFYYFFRNVLYTFKPKFDELTDEIVLATNNVVFNFENKLFRINLLLAVIFILLLFHCRFKYNLDISIYEYLFMNYYHISTEELKLEQNMIFLQNTITDFNSDNIYNFEFIKRNHIISTEITNSYQKNNSNTEKTPKNTNQNFLSKKEKTNYKSRNTGEEDNNVKNNIHDTNSLNSRLTSNNSSLYFMNNNKNNNSNKTNQIKKSKDDIRDIIISNCQKSLPKSLNIFKYTFFIFFIIYEIYIIFNEIEIMRKKYEWEDSTNLSMNIFERIPKLMELLIFTFISVINNNLLSHGQTFEDYINNQRPFIKYFYDTSNTYGKDLIEKYFKNSSFVEFLLDSNAINDNINKYLYNDKHKVFVETVKWENLLGDTGKFCVNAGMGEELSNDEIESVYDFYSNAIANAELCMMDGTNINKSGVKLEINFILQELTNTFIKFQLDVESDKVTKIKTFFNNTDIKRIITDMQIPLVFYFNIISSATVNDIAKRTSYIIMIEISINTFLFAMTFGILIFVFISININEKYKKLFSYFSEFPKIK